MGPTLYRLRGAAADKRRAFTLIEVLVVVAIIALLVAILLPSLAKAREQTRSALCLSNLKQMGSAVQMYTIDAKGQLPGPVHNPIYHDSYLLKEKENDGRYWWRVNLPFYIQKYLGDASKSALLVDKVATCPTADKIEVRDPQSTGHAVYQLRPGHYLTNTGGGLERRKPPGDKTPYYGTWPPDYFGWTNVPYTPGTKPAGEPKKIESIENQSREWMIADLWVWQAAGRLGGGGAVGTWMYDVTNGLSGSVSVAGLEGLKVPAYPYHLTLKSFSPADVKDTSIDSPRLTEGRTNSVYFDGHAASVLRWRGTVNPNCGTSKTDYKPCR